MSAGVRALSGINTRGGAFPHPDNTNVARNDRTELGAPKSPTSIRATGDYCRVALVVQCAFGDPVTYELQLRRCKVWWAVVGHARSERRSEPELLHQDALAWLVVDDD